MSGADKSVNNDPVKKKRNESDGGILSAFVASSDFDIESMLTTGEKVVTTARFHWAIYWKSWVVLFFAVLIGSFIAYQLGIILGVFGLILMAYGWLRRRMMMLVLTNKRILTRYGILQVDVVSMRFKHIESVELERMLPGFIFGYSSIGIMGTGNRLIYLPYVANGIAFRRAYNEMVLDADEMDDALVERAKNIEADTEKKIPTDDSRL